MPVLKHFFRSALALVLTGLCVAVTCDPVLARTDAGAVRAIGTARIEAGDVVRARESAVAEGLRSAVEQATIAWMPPEKMIRTFPALSETVFKAHERYIGNFKVLAEARTGDTYRVLVEAVVSMDAVAAALQTVGIGPDQKAAPKVLILLVEKPLNRPAVTEWLGDDMAGSETVAGRELAGTLAGRGLEVIDRTTVADQLRGTVITMLPGHSRDAVTDLGRRVGADIVVAGYATAEVLPNVMTGNLKSFKGTTVVTAYRCETAEEIAKSEETSVVAGTEDASASEQALAASAAAAGEKIADRIMTRWRRSDAPQQFELIVGGTRHLGYFVQFRRALEALPQVENVLTREMKPDEAVLWIAGKGGPKSLAEAILLQTFDNFGVDIFEVSPNRLKLSLIPR